MNDGMISPPERTIERAEEAVAAIAQFIANESDSRKRSLLMRDFAHKSLSLNSEDKIRFNDWVIRSFMSPNGQGDSPTILAAPSVNARPIDVMMLAVQPIELRALRHMFGVENERRSSEHKDRSFWECEIPRRNVGAGELKKLNVALTSVGMPNNLQAMGAVHEIAEAYVPRVWVLVGMSAGIKGLVRLGDVVLPQIVWYYEPGRRLEDLFEPRPESIARSRLNHQLAAFDPASERLQDRLRRTLSELPRGHKVRASRRSTLSVSVLRDAIASGEKLLRDEGKTLVELHGMDQRIRYADQESYGFALACSGVEWLIARGVSDFADGNKDDKWQFAATCLAVCTVLDFLENDYEPRKRSAF